MIKPLTRIFFLLNLLQAVVAWGQTVLWFQSDPFDYIGAGQTQTYQAPADSFSVTRNYVQGVGTVSVTVQVAGWTLELASANNAALAPGAYESAARAAFRGSSPGLEFTGNGRGCNTLTGRFVIREITVNGIGVVQSLAADFEQHCEGGTPALWGEVRINSAIPLTINKPPGTTTPDAFAFAAQTQVPPSTIATSDVTTIYGINAPAPISVTGGSYSVNGGAYTTAPGTVSNRDHVGVRLTASASGGVTATAILTVGSISAAFNVTTYQTGQPISALHFVSYGDWVGQSQTVYLHPPDWIFQLVRNSPDKITVNMNGPSGAYWTLNLAGALGAPLDVGAFEEAARASFRGASPGLDFSGNGRGCNKILGRFSVLEADFSNLATPHFAANFEQWCDGGGPLLGEIRVNSTVPPSFLVTDTDSMPDPMALWAQSPVKAGSTVYSNWTRVNGVNVGVPISISGPASFSINGGDFDSSPRTAYNLDLIEVSMKASVTPGATAQSTLNVGGLSIPFSVTTYQPGQSLTGLYFRSSPGDYIGQGDTQTYLAPYNGFTLQSYSNGFLLSVTGLGGDWWYLRMTSPSGNALTPGVYEGATRFGGSGAPGLDFSGNGRGCNQVGGRFVVYEAVYNPDGSIERFSADFEQHCEINGPPLYGEFRYNATTAFSFVNAAFVSAASRKSHGPTGIFDLALTPVAIDGPVTLEPRVIGSGHTIVFRFDSPIWNPGTATCVDASGSNVGTISSLTASENEVTVNLTGIGDNRRVTVALANVNGSGISASASLGFLVGDVNGTKTVTAADLLRIKGRQERAFDSHDFQYDLDLSGDISSADLQLAKERSGLSLP